jgi:formate hydrogenlyase subunit 3/multisubunit Na+/H+ antiporter MnhD subunit
MKHIGTLLILVGLGLAYYTLNINTPANVLTSPDSPENQKNTLLTITGVLLFGGLLITMYGARKGAKDSNLS